MRPNPSRSLRPSRPRTGTPSRHPRRWSQGSSRSNSGTRQARARGAADQDRRSHDRRGDGSVRTRSCGVGRLRSGSAPAVASARLRQELMATITQRLEPGTYVILDSGEPAGRDVEPHYRQGAVAELEVTPAIRPTQACRTLRLPSRPPSTRSSRRGSKRAATRFSSATPGPSGITSSSLG